jgi:hypothetical protein
MLYARIPNVIDAVSGLTLIHPSDAIRVYFNVIEIRAFGKSNRTRDPYHREKYR